MDELATKLVDSLTKVENALETMAPEAFGYLITAALIDGWVGVAWAVVSGGVFIASARLCWSGVKAETACFNTGLGRVVSGGIAVAMSGIVFVIAIFGQATWLKIINPTAYVVKTLLAQ